MSPVERPKVSSTLQKKLNKVIRDAVGLTQDPPPMCNDPELAYFPVDAVARLVHGDLATMIIGGLGSLFLQMLHPHAMAGVAQHSRYQEDATGRLLQTANFIGHTTYGPKSVAYLDIERVKAVHEVVQGIADDGVAYSANDPHLLLWVHICEAMMFLDAFREFGTITLSATEVDQYVAEMSVLARDLGIEHPPMTYAELRQGFESFRPELRLSADGAIARDFLMNGYVSTKGQRIALNQFVRASQTLMPEWSREMLAFERPSLVQRVFGNWISMALCNVTRYFVPPVKVADLG